MASAVALAKTAKNISDPKDPNNVNFDKIIWEALRLEPLNPWVTRFATKDFKMVATHEFDESKQMELEVEEKSLILAAMASGSRDSAYFNDPNTFKLDRSSDSGRYIHTSFGFHECLGADVVTQMLPEIIKQVLANLEGINNLEHLVTPTVAATATTPEIIGGIPDKKGGPFPESWIFRFDRSNLAGKPTAKKEIDRYVKGDGASSPLLVFLASKNANVGEMSSQIATAYDLKNCPLVRMEAINKWYYRLATSVDQKDSTVACLTNQFPAAVDLESGRKEKFCATPHAFRSCFIAQRSTGNKSVEQAYITCVYEKLLLTADQRLAFKRDMASNRVADSFSFLNYVP